jgi:hypothetical protein
MSDWYRRDGSGPVDVTDPAFKELSEEWHKNKTVRKTDVGDAMVSTVYLGLDHSYGEGPPLIFETMVFGGVLDQQQWRYSTEAQAIEGHARVIGLVEAAEDRLGHIVSRRDVRDAVELLCGFTTGGESIEAQQIIDAVRAL